MCPRVQLPTAVSSRPSEWWTNMAIPFKYSRRSLLIRRVSNSMTVGAVAIVVGVFVAAMAIVGGLDSAINDTSSPDSMILVGRGADSEANSFITLAQLDALKFLPCIKRDDAGNPLVSPELAEQVFMPAGDTLDNLPIRGVLPVSTHIHDKVRMIAGRMFAPGLHEVIIGKLLVHQYPGWALGADLKVGRRMWKVVGVFESGGSSFESEVWADLHSLQEDARRGSSFSSIRLKLVPGADVPSLIQRCADDPRINLQARTIGQPPTVQTMMIVARTDGKSSVLLTGSGYIVTRHKYITIGTKILGQIVEEPIEEGQHIKAGDVLARIDDRDYQAQLRQAIAIRDVAKANLHLFQDKADRTRRLIKTGAISTDDFETAITAAEV